MQRGGLHLAGCLLLLSLLQRIRGLEAPGVDPGFWPRAQELAGRIASLSASPERGNGVTLVSRSLSYTLHDTAAYKTNTSAIDLSQFRTVLGVDEEKRVIHVEAMVTAEELVNAALAHGLVPKVVPTFRHVTVGGAVMSSATSSASHRFGQFHDTCRSLTVLLGNGTIVTCSKTQHSELFHSLSGSYGSLAILLSAEIECEPASRTVVVTCTRHATVEAGLESLRRKCRFQDPANPASPPPSGPVPHFLEALVPATSPVGSKAKTRPMPAVVTIVASFEPPRPPGQAPAPLPWFNCAGSSDLFFHEHVEDVAANLETAAMTATAAAGAAAHPNPPSPSPRVNPSHTFRMPLASYLFRYDRGAYWLAQPGSPSRLTLLTAWFYALNSRSYLTRLLGRWLYSPTNIFALLQLATPDVVAKRLVMMNPSLPMDRAADLVAFTRKTVPISTPIHLCPVRGAQARQPFSPHGHIDTLFVEVGIYGRVEDDSAREHSRRLEHFVASQHGRKSLCGQNFYERAEFWGGFPTYDPHEYQYLRDKYQAEGIFPPIDAKVCEPPPQDVSLLRRYVNSRRRKLTNFLL